MPRASSHQDSWVPYSFLLDLYVLSYLCTMYPNHCLCKVHRSLKNNSIKQKLKAVWYCARITTSITETPFTTRSMQLFTYQSPRRTHFNAAWVNLTTFYYNMYLIQWRYEVYNAKTYLSFAHKMRRNSMRFLNEIFFRIVKNGQC